MNHDPVDKRLRELSWRRPLTESEQAELRVWLAAHPEAQPEWEVEADLSAMLHQLPDAPMSSNFTARVLQAAERDAAAGQRRPGIRWSWRWRERLPWSAAAAAVVAFGLFAYYRRGVNPPVDAARIVATVPEIKLEALEDFDAIRGLTSTPRPDEDLLALMK